MRHPVTHFTFRNAVKAIEALIFVCLVLTFWIYYLVSETWHPQDEITFFGQNLTRPLPTTIFQRKRKDIEVPRICMSPEKDVPWPLSGTCNGPEHSVSMVSKEQHSCGFCSSSYLRMIAKELEQYREKCQDLVVYGVGFGAKFVGFINEAVKLRMDESVCSFHFVLSQDADVMEIPPENEIIIRVDGSVLPYKEMRRNVKIFKLSPLDLFPWADRVIWRDTKLLPKKILPSSYMTYYNNTVYRFDTCVSLVNLPIHDSSMGTKFEDLNFPEYKGHCGAIVDAAIVRPTVSDGLKTFVNQCQQTLLRYNDKSSVDGSNFLDRSLIDSALMVWDTKRPDCKKYIGDLTCSWLDEIHCFSDRDQVSFGRALDASGARLSEKLPNGDQIFFKENRPTVHIARPDCHWYFQSLDICYDPNFENFRVAVVIAGTYQRFMFNSTVHHVLEPLVRQSHTVDLFLSLTTGKADAYRFPGSFYPDGLLDGKIGLELEETVTEHVNQVGASVGKLNILDQINIDNDPLIQTKLHQIHTKYPGENAYQFFPVLDLRNDEVKKRNAVGNRNFLLLFRALENLWESVTEREISLGHQYDYVMFLRDDSLWFRDFHLNGVVALGGDVFIPACDARVPPLDPHEMNDHGMITRRGVADIFGRYFSTMFKLDLDACAANLPDEMTKKGKRGCNTEMILKWTADTYNVNVTTVGQGYIQFQRSARVKLVNGTIMECFHKYCQSRHDALILGSRHAEMQTCKSLKESDGFS